MFLILCAKVDTFAEMGFLVCSVCFRFCAKPYFSAYSEGDMPKWRRKIVEKWARFEKPTV